MGKPSFIIIGSERCGTTSLYHNICQHPKVYKAYTKEIEFFNRYYDRGESWYHMQFDNKRPGMITGEATPEYFWNPAAALRMWYCNQNLKLILITRHPEEAIKSRYNQQVVRNCENLSFQQALAFEKVRIAGDIERALTLPYCYYPALYAEHAYKDRYDFDKHIHYWKKFDLLVVSLEDLKAKPNEVMNSVFLHIRLDYYQGRWLHMNKGVDPANDDLCAA